MTLFSSIENNLNFIGRLTIVYNKAEMNTITNKKSYVQQAMRCLCFLILLTLTSLTLLAQTTCFPEGIIFNTQESIDSFPINYPNCTNIQGDVEINDQTFNTIYNLLGLSNIKVIDGDLVFYDNLFLDSLEGLDSLVEVGGNFIFQFNWNFEEFNHLESLKKVGGLYIVGCGSLTSLAGLDNITSINGDLSISSNYKLSGLDGLESVSSVSGGLFIDNNENLVNLNALRNIQSFEGKVLIYENFNLQSLEGLSFIEVATSLIIHFNYSLKDLKGLRNLHTISTNFDLRLNNSLVNLDGLNSLEFIGTELSITLNPELKSLNGIGAYFGGHFERLIIADNGNLESIDAIAHTDLRFLNFLEIRLNPKLNDCAVTSVCEYLADDGDAFIMHNLGSCNDKGLVKDACVEKANDFDINCPNLLSPNPATNWLHIKPTCFYLPPILYEIYNADSRMILEGLFYNEPINISTLPSGMYFIKITIMGESKVERFVKI